MDMIDADLPEALRLQRVSPGEYQVPAGGEELARDVVNGVQLMAWSMAASALEGLNDKSVKTAHGVFSRPTARSAPIALSLDRFYSGRAFGADTVTVTQNGKNAARVQLLLAADEDDLIRHADAAPLVAGPDDCQPWNRGAIGLPGIELRGVGDVDYVSSEHPLLPPELHLWIRSTEPINGRVANQAMLCASTGTMLIGTAMLPHAGIGQDQAHRTISTGVVGHTASYHEPFDLGEWHLLAQESIYAGHGRTHGRARVFNRDGQLVASYVQDAMIRHFTDGRDHSAQARSIM
jgi:acyl-CoA thioesterase-2